MPNYSYTEKVVIRHRGQTATIDIAADCGPIWAGDKELTRRLNIDCNPENFGGPHRDMLMEAVEKAEEIFGEIMILEQIVRYYWSEGIE